MFKTRTQILESFRSDPRFAVGDPIVSPVVSDQDEIDAEDDDSDTPDQDGKVSQAIANLQEALEALKAAQAEDADATDDPADDAVSADIEAIEKAVAQLKADQNADEASEPDAGMSLAADAPPKTTSVDDEGNIDPNEKCADPDCGHPASVHANGEAGDNTGACTTPGCGCDEMQLAKVGGSVGNPDDGGGADNADGGDAPVENQDLAMDGTNATIPDVNAPPIMDGGAAGAAFVIPVGVIEGQDTGDGRSITPNGLTWVNTPAPLMGLKTSPHDPSGMSPNDPAVIIGRIDSFERVPGEGGTQVIMAKGVLFTTPEGLDFTDIIGQMGRCGVSADIQVVAHEVTGELDEVGFPIETQDQLTEGIIMGFTVCPFPAFNGCYIVLGDGTADIQAIPQQDPNSQMPDLVASGGQLIHYLSLEDCEPCAEGIDVLVASGAGPTRPPSAWFANPNFTEGDERLQEIFSGRGEQKGHLACPLTVTEDGQIFGHIAPWGVCHIGYSSTCVTPPKSKTDYAHFRNGSVLTAEGELFSTGVLTAGTGHASLTMSLKEAERHYDHSGYACADVNIGEDDYGIWIAGAVRPDATDEQVRALRGASLSGDWREKSRNPELIRALTVNTPGFPVTPVKARVSNGVVSAMVASGATEMRSLVASAEPVATGNEDVALRQALKPVLGFAARTAKRRIAENLK